MLRRLWKWKDGTLIPNRREVIDNLWKNLFGPQESVLGSSLPGQCGTADTQIHAARFFQQATRFRHGDSDSDWNDQSSCSSESCVARRDPVSTYHSQSLELMYSCLQIDRHSRFPKTRTASLGLAYPDWLAWDYWACAPISEAKFDTQSDEAH